MNSISRGGGAMSNNGEGEFAFSFVKFTIFRQFLILEFHI